MHTQEETQTVPPVQIVEPVLAHIVKRGIPIPTGRFALNGELANLREIFRTMQVGDSFLWPRNKPLFDAARQIKIRITTRKTNGDGYRVWKVK